MTDAPHKRLSMIVAVLLVVSAALFAVGVAVERSQASSESPAAAAAEAPGHVESGSAGSEAGEAAAEAPAEPTAEVAHTGEGGESILGINPESWGLVAVGIAISVLLAITALTMTGTSRRNLLFGAIALFGLVFAILDVRELIHQVSESRAGIATLAAVLVLLHLMLSATALRVRSRAPAA